jgi:hypothetical protein
VDAARRFLARPGRIAVVIEPAIAVPVGTLQRLTDPSLLMERLGLRIEVAEGPRSLEVAAQGFQRTASGPR